MGRIVWSFKSERHFDVGSFNSFKHIIVEPAIRICHILKSVLVTSSEIIFQS